MDDKNNTVAPAVEAVALSPEQLKLQERLCAGRSVIGIYIGSRTVSVAQSAVYQGKPTLLKAVAEDIVASKEGSHDESVAVALKAALAKVNIRQAQIICVLPGYQSVVEIVHMPIMPAEELQEAVKLEILNSQRYSIHNPVFDYKVLGRVVEKGVEKNIVVLAVASQTSINNLTARLMPQKTKPLAGGAKAEQVLPSLGINLSAIIPSSIAIENIIRKSKFKIDETLAVLYMGTFSTELNVYSNAHLEFSRQIAVTNFDLTRGLMGAFYGNAGKVELSVDEAERIKYEYGIPLMGEVRLIENKITSSQIFSLLRPKLEHLASEIQRSFDFYSEKTRTGKVDRLLIFGSGAKIKGLDQYLASVLDLSVSGGDPEQDIELLFDGVLGSKKDARGFTCAIGASLGDPKGINLLPAHFQNRQKRFYQRMFLGTLLAVYIGILGIVYFHLFLQLKVGRAQLTLEMSEYQGLVPELQKLKYGINVQLKVKERADWGILFKELSSLPDDIYLTELDIKGNKVHFSGVVREEDEVAKEAPDQLLLDLQNRILPDATFVSSKQKVKKSEGKSFEIEGHMGGQQ